MKITILLADDHAVVRDGLRMLLEAQPDFQVVGDAANGREAVRRGEQLRPDVAVMDIAMPELNGIEATSQMREKSPSTQVIILSMFADSENIHRALQAGVKGYLLKDEAGVEVVQAVRAVHAGRRYLTPRVSDQLIEDFLVLRQREAQESPLERLSPREREVLQLLAEGKSTSEIATILPLSPRTVETYRHRLMEKLGIPDLPSLVRFAIKHGITPLS